MRSVFILIPLFAIAGCDSKPPKSVSMVTGPKLSRTDKAKRSVVNRKPLVGEDRWYKLGDYAIDDALAGNLDEAKKEAEELLKLVPAHKTSFNYGNAIQDANLALGEVALRQNDIESAKKYLLEAGKTPGSPQLSSFGPDPILAADLFAKGEKNTVLNYLDECGSFWHGSQLARWHSDVEAGNLPRE